MSDGFVSGFLERKPGGRYEGELRIDGVDISPIEGVYFKQDDNSYLWLKRKPMLRYNDKTMTYVTTAREPRWEAYLKKQVEHNTVAYKGSFTFLRFAYSIMGVWDIVLGREHNRLNFYVERLPMSEQLILSSINERKRCDKKKQSNEN